MYAFYLPTNRDDTSIVHGLDRKARGTLTTAHNTRNETQW